MPNPDGSLSYEEAYRLPTGIRQGDVNQASEAIGGQPDNGSSNGAITYEQAVAAGARSQTRPDGAISYEEATGQQRPADPINQATSVSAAAVADNSWFSPEFRSGQWYKDYVAPAATAAQTAARVVGRAMGPLMETPVTTFKPGVVDYASTAQMGVPPQPTPDAGAFTGIPTSVQEGISTVAHISPPKEAFPMHWYGRGMQNVAQILNPQGPPAARALRTGLEYYGGGLEKTSDAIAGMINPLNIGIMFSPELLPLRYVSAANKLLAAGFLLQAFANTPGQWQRFQQAKTNAERGGIVGETLVSYAPAAGLFGRSRVVAARRAGEEPIAEPVGTSEVPPETIPATKEQFTTAVQGRIDELKSKQAEGPLSPVDQVELEHMEAGLGEHGDIHALATGMGFHLTDVEAPAAEAGAAEPAPEPAPPEPKAGPRTEEEAPATETARVGGQHAVTRADFVNEMESRRNQLNGKSPLSDAERQELSEINAWLDSGQIERLARKYKVTLTEGGEEGAKQPSDAQVEGTPTALGVKEGTAGPVETTSGGDNVVGAAQGEKAGGTVPPEAAAEPVTTTKELTPEEAALEERRSKLRAAWEPGATPLPAKLADAITKAEQAATLGNNEQAKTHLGTARRLLVRSRNLSKEAKEAALMRLARVEAALKGIPASTAETADSNVVESNGKIYTRVGYDENRRQGIWKGSRGLVSQPGLIAGLDNKWEARKAIAEAAKEEAATGKKAAPKTETTTAAPVPTTAPEVSREEIGKGEAQPPAPGTKVNHWTWDDGEVVGPGKKPDHSLIRFKDGSEMQFDNKVIREKLIPRAEAKAKGEAPGTTTASVPIMMTKKMEADLKARGMSQAEINKLTPAEAWDILNKPVEEAAPEPSRKETLQKEIGVGEARLKSKIDELGNKLTAKAKLEIRKQLTKDKAELKDILKKEQRAEMDQTEKERLEKLKASLDERDAQSRVIMRENLLKRIKKENFPKGQFVDVTRKGTETVDAFLYKGLAIYERPGAIAKPWLVSHAKSGKLVGHFDSLNDAKAFAIRATDHAFDFTRSWDDFLGQKRRLGTANFAGLVSDPYGFIADAAMRVQKAADEKIGGYLNLDIMRDAHEIGRRMYQRGMAFRDWAVNMVKYLGERIVEHLRDIWDSITGRNILPHARTRGGTSPGGPSPGAGTGVANQFFKTRAEAEKFVADNKVNILSHSIIQQPGVSGVQLNYKVKPVAAAGGPVVTPKGAIVLPKFNPANFAGLPVVNAGSGATIKPPPPGSALGPTPPGSNPHSVWLQRSMSAYRKSWEQFWPGAYAAFRLEKKTPVINVHQQWIADPAEGLNGFVKAPFYLKTKGLTREQVIDWEHDAVTKYKLLRSMGQGEQQALLNSIKGNPLREYFLFGERVKDTFRTAAGTLNVKVPGLIEGPYLPRLTTRENQILVKIGGAPEGVVTQLRRSMGSFDNSRKYATMKEGEANGVQYREPIEAIIQHERVRLQFISTAKALKSLEEGGVIFRDRQDAWNASKDRNKPGGGPVKMEGFGGDIWWIRNRQEARFIDQNLNNAGSKSPWNTASQVLNNYARNPNLWNPLPHITKNMFFKYILARVNNFTLKRDTAEFMNSTNKQLIDEFHKVFSMPGDQPGTTRLTQSSRIPDIVARETQNWAAKITRLDLGINGASQKYIFEKADPAMRYALWKSYIRKGMDYQEAANNVFFDLVRYDENSGGLNFWKSIPFNFFSTWRTGSYVTMYKAMTTHPIRTLLFFGAVEYIREAIYRNTGQWTHLPIDYLDAPLSEAVESIFKAKKEIAMGRNPLLAGRDVVGKSAAILGSAALFGPGGGQAPDTISDLMKLSQGDMTQLSRVTNMFWGLSQLFNMPQEFLAWKRDGNEKHLVNILTGAAFGTHAAIKYEPRRLGKYIFPEWLPGMAYTSEQKGFAEQREKREATAMKAAETHEERHGVTRGWWQGPEEQQTEDLLRGSGLLKTRRPHRGGL